MKGPPAYLSGPGLPDTDSAPFGVGDRIQIIAPASGELYLGVNDDVLADNRGRFRVRIALR